MVGPATRGNPMSLLRGTSKSSTNLAKELTRQGCEVSSRTVLRLLHALGYSLRGNAKVTEGTQHQTVAHSSPTSTTRPQRSSWTASR